MAMEKEKVKFPYNMSNTIQQQSTEAKKSKISRCLISYEE